jgi:regulatory protein
MMGDEEYRKIRDYALKLLTIRPRSVYEIRSKLQLFLKRKKLQNKYSEKVINSLKENNFLNDGEFAKWWCQQRYEFRPKGKKALSYELISKGIDQEIIDRILSKTTRNMELELAKKVLIKKLILWGKLPELIRKKKISDYLFRRGFSTEIIYIVIDESCEKT